MNPLQMLFILRARYKMALLVAFLTVATVLIGSHFIPRQYTADTSLMVDVRAPDPVAAILMPSTVFPGSLGTQVEIIKSDRVANKVVAMLGLTTNPAVKEMWLNATKGRGKMDDWIATLMQRGLTVTPSRDSTIVDIAYRGTDPAFVAAVANAFAQAYIETSVELKVEPARQYSRWFGDQAKVLRENVEKAQARLSDFQQKSGIVASDDAMDYELAKLNDLSSRLTAAQGEVRDAQSKQGSGSAAVDMLPDVMQNTVVQTLRSNIIQQEAKLKEAAGNLGTKHPQYLRMEAELAELKTKLIQETGHVASGYSASAIVGKTKEAEIKQAFEAQKAKVLKMKNDRDQISVLVRDVDTAKRAYEAVTTRYNQTNLESQSTQTNISVLAPAIAPLEPSFPKPLLQMVLMAILIGIALGCGTAFLLELLDRRIRSAADLAEMLQVPVLGVIVRPKAPRRLGFRRSTGTALVAQ